MITSSAARVTPTSDARPAWEIAVLGADDVRWARIAAALTRSNAVVRQANPAERLAPVDLLVVDGGDLCPGDLALVRALRARGVQVPIVAVCRGVTTRTSRRALDAGISGVVAADRVASALAPTVAAVLAGQTVVPAQLSGGLRRQSLSYREKQILGLVVLGLTNSQIAARLFLAESTVKSHLSSSFGKLGVASRSEAAALILDPDEAVGAGVLRLVEQWQATEAVTPA